MEKWNGKNKAVTFSFDDGVTQDKRLVDIFNRLNLKCTFNINSGLLGKENQLFIGDKTIQHNKIQPEEVSMLYSGHEIAAHGCLHCDLTKLSDDKIVEEIEKDREILSDMCGYDVVGMAYAGGCVNERVIKVLKERTGIKYSRTILSTRDFSCPTGDLLFYKPTTYIMDKDFEDVVDRFLETNLEKPMLLYIWGHSFEFDIGTIPWEKFERICQKLSGHNDIFYGTNREVLL